MRTIEQLCEETAKALSLGLRRGVKNAIRGQKKQTAVRGGAKINFVIDGDLVAEFDRNGNWTGGIDLKLNGPVIPQLPNVGGEVGASGGAGSTSTRSEQFTGDEKVTMEVWCEYANILAIEEDEDNFGATDTTE